jgi:hypothetical protein
MQYTLRRRLSRTWLLAIISLALAALAVIAGVTASPGGLIRLGQDTAAGSEQTPAPSSRASHPNSTEYRHT